MAAGLGLEPSHPVLETSALANILTRNVYSFSYSSVRNAKRLSALPVKICGIRRIPGRDSGIRTHTGRILSPLSLPVGLYPHKGVLGIGRHP